MEAEDDMLVARMAFDLQRSLVGNSGLTEKSFASVQKTVKELFDDIVNLQYPWEAKEAVATQQSQLEGLIEKYKHLIGDPDDPEFANKLLEDYKRSLAPAETTAKETESQRIDRLLRERDAKYRSVRT